jgi:uncharacterized heparinase superfamily protein
MPPSTEGLKSGIASQFVRFGATIGGLPVSQAFFVVARRVQRHLPVVQRPAQVTLRPATEEVAAVARDDAALIAGLKGATELPPDELARGRRRYCGVTAALEGARRWDVTTVGQLWSFELHYHAELTRLLSGSGDELPTAAAVGAAILGDWLDHATPSATLSWHPYCIATRARHWLNWLLVCGERIDPVLRRRVVASLGAQLGFLRRRIEYDLAANHLTRDLAALAAAGCLLEGADAAGWRRVGLRGLERSLALDVLADGVHVERSPMYHVEVLADALWVMRVASTIGVEVPQGVRAGAHRLLTALEALARSDGAWHQFNDSAAAPPGALDAVRAYATPIGIHVSPTGVASAGGWSLPAGGYFGFRCAESSLAVIVDAGPPGPRYQPGHAHCDTLSFECEAYGRLVITDAGVHGYDGDRFRHYSRSVRAHNTVQVDDDEQHEIWATFRVGRFGRVSAASATGSAGEWSFAGTFRGYTGYTHSRRFSARAIPAPSLTIVDSVQARRGATARSRLLLHPAFSARVEGHTVSATDGTLVARIVIAGASALRVVRGQEDPPLGWYFRSFGHAESACCVEAEWDPAANDLTTTIDISRVPAA